MSLSSILIKLLEIESIKFGSFTLKSKIKSPIYIDLRKVISHPKLLKAISDLMYKKTKHLQYDLLCGVPYTALPIATAISLHEHIPMILTRKEAKNYGTKKMVEGSFEKGQTCVIIEDIVTSGSSILKTIDLLHEEGLKVRHAVTFLDRDQGGFQKLKDQNIELHSVTTLPEAMQILQNEHRIDPITVQSIYEFIEENQV